MMNEAATARANSIQIECKKDALKQMQSGEWSITLKANADDMQAATVLMQAPMGTRYMAVLVEINDDETPVIQQPEPKEPPKKTNYAQQAGIMCNQAGFWRFLEGAYDLNCFEDDFEADIKTGFAASFTRRHCSVESRADLDTDLVAGEAFRLLKIDYDNWASGRTP